MAQIRKKSTILILISVCLMIVLTSSALQTMYTTQTVKRDAEIVNRLGIIRGSIQRLIKLETVGQGGDDLIEEIDGYISYFVTNQIQLYDRDNEVLGTVESLSDSWEQLKSEIYAYRSEPENQQSLIGMSEEVWGLSNAMVLASQLHSESKMGGFRTTYIFLSINVLLSVLIIFLIKRYVKDTLESMVNFDGLTKIYNRRYFNDCLTREIERATRYKRNFSLIMFDIDHFKKVNDTYGHDVGDQVLIDLARIVGKNIRKDDIFARIGGEEFGVILPETTAENAKITAEKIRVTVSDYPFSQRQKITISLGVAEFTAGDNADTIFKKADNALYSAKNSGRNCSKIAL